MISLRKQSRPKSSSSSDLDVVGLARSRGGRRASRASASSGAPRPGAAEEAEVVGERVVVGERPARLRAVAPAAEPRRSPSASAITRRRSRRCAASGVERRVDVDHVERAVRAAAGSTPALSPSISRSSSSGPARADRRPGAPHRRQPTRGADAVAPGPHRAGGGDGGRGSRRRAVARPRHAPHAHPRSGQHGDHGGPARVGARRAPSSSGARPTASRTSSTPRAPAASC